MRTILVNCRKTDAYDILVGRPSKYGNPWTHLDGTTAEFKVSSREKAIDCYKRWLKGDPDFKGILTERRQWILDHLEDLRGKTIACFCSPKACHGDILIEFLEGEIEETYENQVDDVFG